MNTRTHIGLKELAGYLQLPSDRLALIAGSLQLGKKIPVERISAFLDTVKRAEALTGQFWALPEALLNDATPWGRALVRAYEEPVSFPASLAPLQGRQLLEMILSLKPKTVVEIGCYIGVSTLWIAHALETLGGEGRVLSVDLFYPKFPVPPFSYDYLHDPEARAKQALQEAGLGHRSTFYRCLSSDFATRFPSISPGPIDFVFVDGDHSDGGCLDDFISFYPLLRIGGQMLFHDIHPEVCSWTGPRFVLDKIIGDAASCRVEEIETEPNFGMALITKVTDDSRFHPGGDARINYLRRKHRLKAAVGFSTWYQFLVKPLLKTWKGRRGK